MKFILVSSILDHDIYVNVDNICTLYRYGNHCMIYMSCGGEPITAYESVESVLGKIKDLYEAQSRC